MPGQQTDRQQTDRVGDIMKGPLRSRAPLKTIVVALTTPGNLVFHFLLLLTTVTKTPEGLVLGF